MCAARKQPVLEVKFDEQLIPAYERSTLEDKNPFHGYATNGSAGIDIKAAVDKTIGAEETELVRTAMKVAIPPGHVGILASRSSVGIGGLVVSQGVGVIDSDYRGELMVPLYNRTYRAKKVNFGDRIAQLLIVPVIQPKIVIMNDVEELEETERGEGGFGSTGE